MKRIILCLNLLYGNWILRYQHYRHVIHTALQDVPNVTTYSTGTEPNRRVIVAYDREKK